MEDDVLAKNPDVVLIYIGVNDVWHKTLLGTGTDPDKFEKFYQAILDKLKAKNIRAILCTPAVIGEKNDFTNPLDGDINRYCKIVAKLAGKNGLVLVNLRQGFLKYLLDHNPDNKDRGILTYDGVHMNDAGNEFLAERMWEGLRSEPSHR
jgi:lysophospholipase L1-like esterase